MRELRAPDGCNQYFLESSGIISTFNHVDDPTSMSANDAEYSICFKSWPEICAVAVQKIEFYLGCKNGECTEKCLLESSHISIPGAMRTDGTLLESDRFCGEHIEDVIITDAKPFVARVKVKSGEANNFVFLFNLLDQCKEI